MMYNFACVCYGDKYPVEYVQKLYNMVSRNTNHLINFYVFTDHVKMNKMVDGGRLYVKQFPEHDLQGWWNKMQLFHPDVQLPGNTLYMDLDVVITDNIDCFYDYEPGIDFIGMNDFNPCTGLWNSSIMRFNNQHHSRLIWEEYMKRRSEFSKFHGDQEIISLLIKKHEDTISFPDEWTQSYKWYNREGKRYHSEKWTYEQDPNAKVCVFHGRPNPAESTQEWVKELWK